MRIIAGAKRGMKLLSPQIDVSRPITDRVKESLFDVLWNYGFPENKIVADLFCGIGSLGLEALSRGAEFVAFVEKDPRIIATLKKNIEKAGFVAKSKVIRADAFRIGAPANVRKYDLIFVDPPYAASRDAKEGSPLSKLLTLLNEQSAVNAIFVIRTEKKIELLERYGLLKVIERRQWGTMMVTILQRSNK
jgi:16S rRNA (guanine(966)-N(2))-methyltransferase RsmD